MHVVDLSEDVAGRFAARLLALGGAEVLRPGSSGVDPLSRYLDAGKTRFVVAADADLADALAGSDLVLTSFDQGRFDGFGTRREAVMRAGVEITTSTFGLTGPYAQYRGGPMAQWAAGGYLALTGEPGREPLCGPEHLCGYVTGYVAAIGAEAALRTYRRTGARCHAEVAAMEVMLGIHQSTFSRISAGIVRRRTGRYAEVYPLTVLPCRDGHVSLGIVSDEEFDRLTVAFGLSELALDPRFQTREARMANSDALDSGLALFLTRHTAAEVVALLQASNVPSAAVADPLDLLESPQLAFRAFWTGAEGVGAPMPGNPIPAAIDFGSTTAPPPSPKPAHRAGALPLAGVRVLDLTAFWAGPSATRCLADLGAEVTWIERPRSRIDFDDRLHQPEFLAAHLYHQKMNRHKRSVMLDLDDAEGRTAVRRLAAESEVVIENFRPGVAAKLGLGPQALCGADPRLIYVSLSGYGAGGPWGDWRSYGPNIEAASSILARTGYRGGGPMRMGHALPDGVGGLAGALAALRGLRQRDETGRGGWFDISQLETYVALSGEEVLAAAIGAARTERIGNRSRSGAIQGVFACSGGDEWIALRLADRAELARFAAQMRAPGLAALAGCAMRDDDAIEAALAALTADHDKKVLARMLQQRGFEAFAVLTPDELVSDPHVAARGVFVAGCMAQRRTFLPAFPVRCDPPMADPVGRAPRFGEHTAVVLAALAQETSQAG